MNLLVLSLCLNISPAEVSMAPRPAMVETRDVHVAGGVRVPPKSQVAGGVRVPPKVQLAGGVRVPPKLGTA